MLKNVTRLLAIAPHTDDLELACGGTINVCAELGVKVTCVAFSDCEDTLEGTDFDTRTLGEESREALALLGVKKNEILIYRQTNKHFHRESRAIFRKLESLREKLKPDLVLIPSLDDTHEDHRVVAQQALHVFRRATSLMSYEQPWNNLAFRPGYFVTLTAENIKKKVDALSLFKTQAHLKRPYFDKDFILGLARTRGIQMGAEYAEAFEVIKLIQR
jgi:LmbE family N-acetylglucosaminyl deacetylase